MHPRLALCSHLASPPVRSCARLPRSHVPRYHPSRCWVALAPRHLRRRHWTWPGGGGLERWLYAWARRPCQDWLPYMPQARRLRRLSSVDSSGVVCLALALSRCRGERATRPSLTKSAFWSIVVANKSRCVRPPSHVVSGLRASWSHMLRRLEDNRCLFTTWAGATSLLMAAPTLLAFVLLLSRRMM
jgi:hypothetical protein